MNSQQHITPGLCIQDLRRLAVAATSGVWHTKPSSNGLALLCRPESQQDFVAIEDAEYIAAAQPLTVVALLDRLEAAEKKADALSDHVATVEHERDEADRRAGAAERENASLKEQASARKDWLSEAKKEAGYDDNVSFDIVWDETLESASRATALAAHIEHVHNSINDLIAESEGVAGLHKNGDIAPWSDLLEGGHFEGWLLCLSEQPDTTCLARRDKKHRQRF